MNKSKKFILYLFLIIFIFALVNMNLSQEINKEKTIQEEVNAKKSQQNKKDSPPQEENKTVKTETTAIQKSQQKYDYDLAELLRESQRNLNRSTNILNVVATIMGVLVGLLTLIIIIASASGFFEFKRWRAIRIRAETSVNIIEDMRDKAEKDINNRRKEIDKTIKETLLKELPKNKIKMLDDFSRRLEIIEWLGMPLTAEDYITRGNDLYYKNNFEFSLKAYDKAIELKPDYEAAWNNKGISLTNLKRFEEGLKAYDKAIELKPDYVDAWFNKACLYSLKGDKENTLRFLSKTIDLDTKYKEKARKDEDFKEYWEDEEFKKIIS